jgi:hypothetical protein
MIDPAHPKRYSTSGSYRTSLICSQAHGPTRWTTGTKSREIREFRCRTFESEKERVSRRRGNRRDVPQNVAFGSN